MMKLFCLMRCAFPLVLLGTVALLPWMAHAGSGEESAWNCFRGPACGVSAWTNAPVMWDGKSGVGVLWKTPLKLSCVSSPVLWDKLLFLTEGDPAERAVLAFDADTGQQVWRRVVADGGKTPKPTTQDAGLAYPTPVCDAHGVYALFGTGDLAAFAHDGTPKWQLFIRRPVIGYGFASSPCVVSNLVFVQFDDHSGGTLTAVETATGKIKWQRARSRGASWTSPIVIPDAHGRPLVAINATGSITAFDLEGNVVWDEDGPTGEVTPSLSWWNHKLYALNVRSHLLCYDVTGAPKKVFDVTRHLADVPSPVLANGLLFMASSQGRLVCLDALTGEELWNHENPGCYASLVASGGRVYALGRDGAMYIVAAERSYRVISACYLGDGADATPALADGRMYIRGRNQLWCLGAAPGQTVAFGAHLQEPKCKIEPAADGSLNLTATVGLLGGCCFPLTSHDIKAALTAPPGITVLAGPAPATYAAIEAPVSGTAQVSAVFRWRLQRQDARAEYPLKITVTSSDSATVEATPVLGLLAACRVTGPQLPALFQPGHELPVAVEVACVDEARYVQSVRFCYCTEVPQGARPAPTTAPQAQQGLLAFTVEGHPILVQGRTLALARKYEPTVWRGVLPAQTNGPLFGLAVAQDDAGGIACGPIVTSALPAQIQCPPPVTQRGQRPARPFVVGSLLCAGLTCVLLRAKRKGLATLFALGCVLAGAAGFTLSRPPAAQPSAHANLAGVCPTNGSAVVYLFLDRGEASHTLAQQIEALRADSAHRLHVLCFVDGLTPAALMEAQRQRLHVAQLPAAVFDVQRLVPGTDPEAVRAAVQAGLDKPSPLLSMELRGGVIAGRALSLGFIMCNHAPRPAARGKLSVFTFENAVALGDWRCDHVVRAQLVAERSYDIPHGKCQPPTLITWDLPEKTDPAKVGSLTIILDAEGHPIDAICTEQPCLRAGACG